MRSASMALAWLAGVVLQMQQRELWPHQELLGLAALAALMAVAVWRWRARAVAALFLACAAAMLGFSTTSLRAEQRLAETLNPALEGPDIEVTGRVAEMPRLSAQGTRFTFEVESAKLAGAAVQLPPLLSLGWYRGADDDSLLATPAEDLRAGQRWRMTVRLRAPHGTLNPNGFDVELWLFEQGIGGTGSVRARPETPAVKLAENAGHPVERLRQRIRDAVLARVDDAAAAGVLAALAIGNQAAIDREGWDLFRTTGVAHLMSISGLHVTMYVCTIKHAIFVTNCYRQRLGICTGNPTPAI